MADPTNADIERAFSLVQGPLTISDDNVATTFLPQNQALRVKGQMFVVIKAAANNASVVLPSLNGGDAPPYLVVINKSTNSLRVGGAAGNSLNGTLTPADMSAGFITP